MKTIYEEVKEELIMKEIEKKRVEVREELDETIDDVINDLISKPLIEENEEDFAWHNKLMDRLQDLIYLRRKSIKIESFKELNMEEITKAITGY